MAEFIEGSNQLESTTIGVFRSAATVKGGKRFSFGALVVVGDRRGKVGLGYAKANEVPPAIEKAQKDGRKNMQNVTLRGGTVPHEITGRFGASLVKLVPAAPGTGVVAGATVRAVLEMVGVTDCLTKAYGSTNQKNLAKAAVDGLKRLRAKEVMAGMRSVSIEPTPIDKKLERATGSAKPAAAKKDQGPKGPVNTIGQDRKGGRGGRGGGGGGDRGGRGRPRSQPQESAPPAEGGESKAS